MTLPRIFRPISLEERIAKELDEARIARLAANSQREYFEALQVMYEKRIRRLEQEMADCLDDQPTVYVLGGTSDA